MKTTIFRTNQADRFVIDSSLPFGLEFRPGQLMIDGKGNLRGYKFQTDKEYTLLTPAVSREYSFTLENDRFYFEIRKSPDSVFVCEKFVVLEQTILGPSLQADGENFHLTIDSLTEELRAHDLEIPVVAS